MMHHSDLHDIGLYTANLKVLSYILSELFDASNNANEIRMQSPIQCWVYFTYLCLIRQVLADQLKGLRQRNLCISDV